jgi:hypothetical protein
MHKPPLYERSTTGDPLLDRVDALITVAYMLREDIVRMREAHQHDRDGMVEAARRVARADTMSTKEAAEFLGISASAMEKGVAGTECLYRVREKNGRNVSHNRRRIEYHRQNIAAHKDCDCDQVSFDSFKRAGQK